MMMLCCCNRILSVTLRHDNYVICRPSRAAVYLFSWPVAPSRVPSEYYPLYSEATREGATGHPLYQFILQPERGELYKPWQETARKWVIIWFPKTVRKLD